MTILKLTFVLGFIFSSGALAQNNRGNTSSATVEESSSSPSPLMSGTRLSFDALSAQSESPTDTLNFTSYSATFEQDLGERITLKASMPLVLGTDNGTSFNEWGNPFLGASIKLIELQDYHPLWLTIHGGVQFAQPADKTNVTASYEEIHTGASLIKHFRSIDVITDGDYIQKINDPQPGLSIGNELDAYGGIKVDVGGDISVQGGYIVRHADATRQTGSVLVGDDMYTAAELRLMYKLNANVELLGKMQFPLESESAYAPNLGAFGDLSTQATLGKSWSVGFNLGL